MNAIAGVVTKGGYVDLAKLLIYTLNTNSGLRDLPFIVITTDNDKYALSTKEKNILKKYWKDLRFYNINYELYKKYDKSNPKYWSIEIFNLDFDKIMLVDVDNICVSNIEWLFQQDYKLGMTKERQRPNFSAGLIMANRWYRNPHTYKQLLECKGDDGRFGHDQKVYNTFFPSIQEIDRRWHCKIDEIENEITSYGILHYWLKPTDEKHRKRISSGLLELWDNLYADCNKYKSKIRR